MNGYEKLTQELIEKGASVYAKSNNGYTPLHLAAKEGHVEIVKILLAKIKQDKQNELIAIIDEPNNKGKTALQLAAENGHIDVVIELLNNHEAIKNKDVLVKEASVNVQPLIALHNLLARLKLSMSDQKSRVSLYFLGKSYSAQENIVAGDALKKVMLGKEDISTLEEHQAILNGRELSGIYHQWLAIKKDYANINNLIGAVEKIENPDNHTIKFIFDNSKKAQNVKRKLLSLGIKTTISEEQNKHCLTLTSSQYKNIINSDKAYQPANVAQHK